MSLPASAQAARVKLLWIVLLIVFGVVWHQSAFSHGSILVPQSRIYNCRFNDNPENPVDPACRAAIQLGGTQPIYDWTALRQGNANSQHEDIIPDGELCSGGNALFKGMDLPRIDWATTEISADAVGKFEFIYLATAAHATKDMILYVTKPEWRPGQSIAWSDMEEFCRFGDVPLEQYADNSEVYKMNCDLPQRTGQHVIFNIWQRSDSPEAFYACSDVVFAGMPPDGEDPINGASDEICIPISSQQGKITMLCF